MEWKNIDGFQSSSDAEIRIGFVIVFVSSNGVFESPMKNSVRGSANLMKIDSRAWKGGVQSPGLYCSYLMI